MKCMKAKYTALCLALSIVLVTVGVMLIFGPINAVLAACLSVLIAVGALGFAGPDDDPVSLAYFVAVLTRTYWSNEIDASIPTNPWYARNMTVGVSHGLFNGLGAPAEFDFESPITRAMAAQLICNAMIACGEADVTDVQSVIQRIPDVSDDQIFAHAIAFCYSKGILRGVNKAGYFSPEYAVTHAHAAAIRTRIRARRNQTAKATGAFCA